MNSRKKAIILVIFVLLAILIFFRNVQKTPEIATVRNEELEKLDYKKVSNFYIDEAKVFAENNNLKLEKLDIYENNTLIDKKTKNIRYNNIEIELYYETLENDLDLESLKFRLKEVVNKFDDEILISDPLEFEKVYSFKMEIFDKKQNVSDGIIYNINSGDVIGYPNYNENENFKKIKDIVYCEISNEKGLELNILGKERDRDKYLVVVDFCNTPNPEKLKHNNYKKFKKISDNVYDRLDREDLIKYVKKQGVNKLEIVFDGKCNNNKAKKKYIYDI